MNYLLKSKIRYPNRLRIISLISVFVLLFIFSSLFPKAMRSVFTTISEPVWKVRDVVSNSLANIPDFFASKNSLIAQVNSLQNQITSLQLKQADYDAISKENDDIKNTLGRSDTSLGNRILSRVLSKPPESPYDTFVLDIGTSSGVAVGDKVYISDTIIIGEIASVTGNTSVVNLFSKSGMTNALTLERTGATYQIVGQGGANMSVEVAKDADILWGDIFNYPDIKTSVVGSVYYIDQNPQSSFKTIFIRVPGNVFQTKWVFVQE